eukprot:1349998-Pyramimonas_sp.AAC.1
MQRLVARPAGAERAAAAHQGRAGTRTAAPGTRPRGKQGEPGTKLNLRGERRGPGFSKKRGPDRAHGRAPRAPAHAGVRQRRRTARPTASSWAGGRVVAAGLPSAPRAEPSRRG